MISIETNYATIEETNTRIEVTVYEHQWKGRFITVREAEDNNGAALNDYTLACVLPAIADEFHLTDKESKNNLFAKQEKGTWGVGIPHLDNPDTVKSDYDAVRDNEGELDYETRKVPSWNLELRQYEIEQRIFRDALSRSKEELLEQLEREESQEKPLGKYGVTREEYEAGILGRWDLIKEDLQRRLNEQRETQEQERTRDKER